MEITSVPEAEQFHIGVPSYKNTAAGQSVSVEVGKPRQRERS